MFGILDRIKALDAKLAAINRIYKDGNYLAAWLKFEIQIGEDGEFLEFSLGIQADMEGIMVKLIAALEDTRTWYVRQAREELIALNTYFNIE